MTIVAFVVLALAGAGFVGRAVMGPSVSDRVVALDGLLVVVICGIIVGAVHTGERSLLDVVLVVSLLGFVGTASAARFVERRGDR